MASLPPQQPQRRQAPPQQHSSTEDNQAPSTTSLDSQTVLLKDAALLDQNDQTQAEPSHQQSSEETSEPRKCWICFSDETEDGPNSSVWRAPCPCNLTAHESCLLDWIADIESPEGTRSTASPQEIRCPQCKAEIHIARPRSYMAEALGAFDKFTAKMIVPGLLAGAGYTVFVMFSHHGVHTIEAIFGHRDARRILRPLALDEMNDFELSLLYHFPRLAEPLLDGWRGLRVELGLPLIPLCLIASRSTLADAVLPILPILFFATHQESSETLKLGYWPPSAALTLVMLPYVRSAYDYYLEKVWKEREKAWVREVQPRLTQQTSDNGEEDDVHEEDVQLRGGVELEIGFQMEIEEEVVDDEEDNAEVPDLVEMDAVAGEAEQRQGDGQEGEQQGQQQGQQDQQEQHGQRRVRRQEFDLIRTATRVLDTALGALLFPSVCALSGGTLKLLLPQSWTRAPLYGPPKGLLQTRWGRSIIGGCMFVVLKDAVRIYVRWRMATNHRERRIRDYDKKTGKVI